MGRGRPRRRGVPARRGSGGDVGVRTYRLPEACLSASIRSNPQLQPPIAAHDSPPAMAVEIIHRPRLTLALAGRLVVVRADSQRRARAAYGNARPSSPTPVPSGVERELDGAGLLFPRVEVSG
jgi:hypothetical protein